MRNIILLCIFISTYTETKPARVCIASIPKCGTHMLKLCVESISQKHFQHTKSDHLIISECDVQERNDLLTHAIPSQENIDRLKKAGFKVIFIYRDPRAQSVSMINMVKETDLLHRLRKMPFDKALSRWISHTSELYYINQKHWHNPILKELGGIDELYKLYLPWLDCDSDFVYVTTFEKLVGPKGGGDEETQVREIMNIAQHIGIELSEQKAYDAARKLHGASKPGRKQISAWRNRFKEEHVRQFKDIAGQLLIDLGYEQDINW